MIAVERKRTERSRQPFLLMLLDTGNCLPSDATGKVLGQVLSALSRATRETDVTGWYKMHEVVGVMFTEISLLIHAGGILSTVMNRVSQTLRNTLSVRNFSPDSSSLHIFPEDWNQEATQGNPTLYPDLVHRSEIRVLHEWSKGSST